MVLCWLTFQLYWLLTFPEHLIPHVVGNNHIVEACGP